jgi:S-adenosylmethionine:tRNA ribosyltransferase-isomerase
MVTPDLDDISAWQYELPDDLIASRPTVRRDDSRLMVVRRDSGQIEHCQIRDLPQMLSVHDRLVFNNTKVLPARLFGFRTSTKGKWEGLFLDEQDDGNWRITGQTRGRLLPGESLALVPASEAQAATQGLASGDQTMELQLIRQQEDGSWIVRPDRKASAVELLDHFGTLPLPPYIKRKVADEEDRDRYQTMFAQEPGAIAAPTAGLHFTPELMADCVQHGISSSEVTLHVGIGTFRPVSSQRLSEHRMHSEWCRITQESAEAINATKAAGQKIVAVGTTSVRTLEAAAQQQDLTAWQGSTDIFITPGFRFNVVDQLLTNFHLPGSTLIVLVAALVGYDLTMEAYRQAVAERYRFYSYGDAMLIL